MKSSRFRSSFLTRWLIPFLLIVLLLGLLAVFILVGMSAAGIKL
jgi:hypothetical protein